MQLRYIQHEITPEQSPSSFLELLEINFKYQNPQIYRQQQHLEQVISYENCNFVLPQGIEKKPLRNSNHQQHRHAPV